MSLPRFILNGEDIFIIHFGLRISCKVELGRDKVQRIRLTISPLFYYQPPLSDSLWRDFRPFGPACGLWTKFMRGLARRKDESLLRPGVSDIIRFFYKFRLKSSTSSGLRGMKIGDCKHRRDSLGSPTPSSRMNESNDQTCDSPNGRRRMVRTSCRFPLTYATNVQGQQCAKKYASAMLDYTNFIR